MKMPDGSDVKFQPSKWKEKMKEQTFKDRVFEIIDEEIIQKFDKRIGSAKDFYSIPA